MTMAPPGKPEDRRVTFHESARPPPPDYYAHQQYPHPPHPSMRGPPQSPRDYAYYEGPPPRWQGEETGYYPYDMHRSRDEPQRPYMPPMHGEDPRMPPPPPPPPPPEEYMPRREGPPPRIHYRPSEYPPPSPKRAKRYPGPPPSAEATGEASLDLLAKVAMGGSGDSKNKQQQQQQHQHQQQVDPEYVSPVRRQPPPSPRSPGAPIIWTPPQRYGQHPRGGGGRPRSRGEWREPPPPTYPAPPPSHPRDYYGTPSWSYEGPETPPAVQGRVSFDEGYYSPDYPPPPAYEYDYSRPPPPEYRGRPPYPDPRHQYISPSASHEVVEVDEAYQQMSPYTYVQQPRLKEKVVLRKKFSWKNYPELERYLIKNRDDYLRHSAMNYTAEQKAYNNWLTESLLEVAKRHNYEFDKDDFNFVAIRDRIRCYYKSYVQTARKKGQHIKKDPRKVIEAKVAAAASAADGLETTESTAASAGTATGADAAVEAPDAAVEAADVAAEAATTLVEEAVNGVAEV